MILFKKADELQKYLIEIKASGQKTGFVPTMGALHQGHLSLIENSKKLAEITVCSIFVNPTQFNDPKDFEQYPVTIEQDIRLVAQAGCDLLFLPSVQEIYPSGLQKQVHYDLGRLETLLEGKYRPGHFQGVCQVMHRLLDIVNPGILFMGQKDYQQCMVVQQLITLEGRHIRLVTSPTLRETSGLAMSSRNRRLSETAKENATAVYHALQFMKQHLQPGPVKALIDEAGVILHQSGFEKTDYISICHAQTLEPVNEWDGHIPLIALIAAFIENIRLIDNLPLT
ncbi:MAG: pantoate--beta-alanine ligase [Sediminibacterium sp.]